MTAPAREGGERGVALRLLATTTSFIVVCGATGKVHGSLARAGKVRSQTPKVAKAEKKKNPKGRAAQRVKYNRRFVNVGESCSMT